MNFLEMMAREFFLTLYQKIKLDYNTAVAITLVVFIGFPILFLLYLLAWISTR